MLCKHWTALNTMQTSNHMILYCPAFNCRGFETRVYNCFCILRMIFWNWVLILGATSGLSNVQCTMYDVHTCIFFLQQVLLMGLQCKTRGKNSVKQAELICDLFQSTKFVLTQRKGFNLSAWIFKSELFPQDKVCQSTKLLGLTYIWEFVLTQRKVRL